MQVILIEDLAGKGVAGDTIKVANGYARNYLLPRGIAIPATETNLKTLEHRRAKIAERKDQDRGKAQEISDVIDNTSITLQGKSGKGGRLFGAITTQDIVNEINSVHNIYIDKRKVILDSPIKQVGVHTVHIRLFTDVIPAIRVLVGTPEEIAAAEEATRIAAEKAAARAQAEAEAAARAEEEAAAALAAADAASDLAEGEFPDFETPAEEPNEADKAPAEEEVAEVEETTEEEAPAEEETTELDKEEDSSDAGTDEPGEETGTNTEDA